MTITIFAGAYVALNSCLATSETSGGYSSLLRNSHILRERIPISPFLLAFMLSYANQLVAELLYLLYSYETGINLKQSIAEQPTMFHHIYKANPEGYRVSANVI